MADSDSGTEYEIVIGRRLGRRTTASFPGFAAHDTDGHTTLRGAVRDQAALHGVLARVRDLGLPLLSVRAVDDPSWSHEADRPGASDHSRPVSRA